jgi:hypothetical protein
MMQQSSNTGSSGFRLKWISAALCVVMLTGLASHARASTLSYAPDGSTWQAWGPSSGGNQSYGESFTAPQSELDDYSFYLKSTSPFSFVSQVYAWNGSAVVGPALFTSSVYATTTTMQQYTFTADIPLTPGDMYIAFVTNQPNGVSLGGTGSGYMEQTSNPSANFFFTEGNPAVGNWACGGCTPGAAFTANFSAAAVPEPTSMILFGGGLIALGRARRRRR